MSIIYSPDTKAEKGRQRLVPVPPDVVIHHHDPFLIIQRQSKQLERDLQTLLDAQSAGLTAHLSGSPHDDVLSTGSSTPTPSQLHSSRTAITIPVRQPPRKKIGLRGARRGILKSMHELLSLKEEETRIINSEISSRRAAINDVGAFKSRQDGLKKEISDIQGGQKKTKAETLTREAQKLETEIRDLETKLMIMKARHRHMLNDASEIQNSVDAKLSSYKASLSLLDSDVQRYLRSPPLQPLATPSSDPSLFYSLNPKRRTLDMAEEHWRTEIRHLRNKLRGSDDEIKALNDGGRVWQQVVSAVSKFEKRLQEEMQQSLLSNSQLLRSNKIGFDQARADAILKEMDETTTALETSLHVAEEKGWNLLICCVGAELESFREARRLLQDSLTAEEDEGATVGDPPDVADNGHEEQRDDDDDVATQGSNEVPADLLGKDTPEPSPNPLPAQSEDEDNEPDPAWLLS
ncbi:hypothetical protein AJ80_09556 [Polytolypa hystricis UAMH7299]|uniref:Atg28p n=1 Tax=Polytolypa hystricis (strain UAMH7299) TaxID=1447883 RepID=A0A2B7WNG2_POLH7|nr:hypothetical protein AJ80_09556 [Polytolypa hystricis UAMH7299]